jgi:CheY-like chemotaxis protein
VVEYLRVFRHVGFFRFLAGPVDHWRVSRMPTVLHAEADRVLRNASLSFLSSQGWEVDVAVDALECFAKLRRRVPDLLILDLELPWGGGDGVLGLLREQPHLQPNRVVLTSAVASAHVLGKLASFQQQPPFVLALTKPFPLSALLDDRAFDAVNVRKRFANDRRRRAVLVTD